MKDILKRVKERIKKSFIYKIIHLNNIINDLNTKIGDLEREKQELIDLTILQKIELKGAKNNDIKVATYEAVIDNLNKDVSKKQESNNKLIQKNKKLNQENQELQNQRYDMEMEIKSYKIQAEEYEAQINDLKSDRYLIRKIPSGKTPNTNKTKVARPMRGNVVKYMRGEHE